MANFFKDNDDLQYYFDKGVDWESLVRITEHDFADADGEGFSTTEEAVDFYRDIVEMFGQFTAEEIKPYEKEIDAKGVELRRWRSGLPRAAHRDLREDQGSRPSRPPDPARARRHERPDDGLLHQQRADGTSRRLGDGAPRLPCGHGDGRAGVFGLEGSSEIDPATGRITETRWKR